MHIFLTGTESFIGKVLIRACRARGWRVSGVDAAGSLEDGFLRADIRSPDVADCIPADTDAIVHLAAISRDVDCVEDVPRAYDVNVVGTARIAEAARQRQVGRLVFASSEWVYGSNDDGRVQLEDDAIDVQRASSEYALSKLAGEQLLRVAARMPDSPLMTLLRFGIVYGPRRDNWSAVESIFHDACCRREIQVGSLQTARRFIEVNDVVSGILAACRVGKEGTFNLSGDRLITLADIAETSFAVLGHRVAIRESTPENVSIRNPDNGKIREAFNWRPNVSLSDGLQNLFDFFQSQQMISCPV